MDVKIVSLQGNFSFECDTVTVETVRGQIQVLEQHADMIATIEPGVLLVEAQGAPVGSPLFTGNGILRVEDGDCVFMLDKVLEDSEKGREAARTRLEDLQEQVASGAEGLQEDIDFLERFLAQ